MPVVITTSGAARGGRVGFMAALDCSMFVYLLECLFMIQTMEFFTYYYTLRSRSIYISRPSFIQKFSKMLHSSLVKAKNGVSFVGYGFWWWPNQSFGILLPVLCSISCYTDGDISKATCYVDLTGGVLLPRVTFWARVYFWQKFLIIALALSCGICSP